MEHHIALIRHGADHQRANVPSTLQPFPLTEDGRAQAHACGTEIATILRDTGLSLNPVLYSSCQIRVRQAVHASSEAISKTICKI